MGAEQSTTQKNETLTILSKGSWINVGHRDDRIYGNIKVYSARDQPDRQLAIVSHFCQSREEYSQLVTRLRKSQKLNEVPGMIKLFEIAQQNSEQFCSNMFKVQAAYEYHQFNLQSELEERYNNQQLYQAFELIEFLTQILQTLVELDHQQIKIRDVGPDNMLLSIQDNRILYKLTDIPVYANNRPFSFEEQCYLSPEEFTQFQQRCNKQPIDYKKSNVFRIGLTCLALGCLKNLQGIYNEEASGINEHHLNQLLAQFERTYDQNISNLVRQMLQIQPTQRPTLNLALDMVNSLRLSQHDIPNKLVLPPVRKETSPVNNRYSDKSSKKGSPYQYSQKKVAVANQENQEKYVIPLQPELRNWAKEFLNDSDLKVHIPCNPGEDFLKLNTTELKERINSKRFEYSVVETVIQNEEITDNTPNTPQNNQKKYVSLLKASSKKSDTSRSSSMIKRPNSKIGLNYLNNRSNISSINKLKTNKNIGFYNQKSWMK